MAKGLSEIVKSYSSTNQIPIRKKSLDNEFKNQLSELISILQNVLQPSIDERKLELIKTFAIQLDHFDFYNFFATQQISEEDFKLYQIICEVLFNNRKRHKAETQIEIKTKFSKKLAKQ